jgi:hypothetical protein
MLYTIVRTLLNQHILCTQRYIRVHVSIHISTTSAVRVDKYTAYITKGHKIRETFAQRYSAIFSLADELQRLVYTRRK